MALLRHRKPCWRYLEAIDKVQDPCLTLNAKGKIKQTNKKDTTMIRLANYLYARHHMLPNKLVAKYGRIDAAYNIYQNQTIGSERWLIEALIIGGANVKNISDITGFDDKVIKDYIAFFFDFDIRSSKLFALTASNAMLVYDPDKDQDLCWKFIAIHRGYESFLRIIYDCANMIADDERWLLEITTKYSKIAAYKMRLTINNADNLRDEHQRDMVYKALGVFEREEQRIYTRSKERGSSGIDEGLNKISNMFDAMNTEMVHVYEKFDEEEPLLNFPLKSLNEGDSNEKNVRSKTANTA